jgi:hypothetical protein
MENAIVPSTKIFDNKISFTMLDPSGRQFKEPERLFSIDAKLWDMNQTRNGELPTVYNIPVSNCTIYKNAPFGGDFNNLTTFWQSSKCLDFKDLDTNLYGRYASLLGYEFNN